MEKLFVAYIDEVTEAGSLRIYVTGPMSSLEPLIYDTDHILCAGVSKQEAESRIHMNLLAFELLNSCSTN